MLNPKDKRYLRSRIQEGQDPQRYLMSYLDLARITAPILRESGKPLNIPIDLLNEALFMADTLGHPQTLEFVEAALEAFQEIYF